MSRYIDADKLNKEFNEILDNPEEYDKPIHDMLREFYSAPTVDVEPVRHGRWLRVGQSFIDPNKFLCFECSICRCTLDNHIKVEQNYCPNCGARMDGEEE